MSTLMLGKTTTYKDQYDPSLLYPIAREKNRSAIHIQAASLPFYGEDIWHAYEISWLNKKGKPNVAIGRFVVPSDSPNLIESKSLKLYLNSFNQTAFDSVHIVREKITHDLSLACGKPVRVTLFSLNEFKNDVYQSINGICLDDYNVEIKEYTVNSNLLKTKKNIVSETVYSTLLKSNCLVTNQPDWGTIQIEYCGPQIQHESLLKYIVSFRNHNEFHEHCVERIFMDIKTLCKPTELTITACYTRRGGLDINPFRTTKPDKNGQALRCPRQ